MLAPIKHIAHPCPTPSRRKGSKTDTENAQLPHLEAVCFLLIVDEPLPLVFGQFCHDRAAILLHPAVERHAYNQGCGSSCQLAGSEKQYDRMHTAGSSHGMQLGVK